VTDLAHPALGGLDGLPPGAVPGATVRSLVTWTEGEIDLLLRQLDEAEREAGEAEREADQLAVSLSVPAPDFIPTPASAPTPIPAPAPTPAPAPIPMSDWKTTTSAPVPGGAFAGVPEATPTPAAMAPSGRDGYAPVPPLPASPPSSAPRTTVVVRPSAGGVAGGSSPAASVGPAIYDPDSASRSGAGSHRRSRSGWFRTHLMMKAGVALVLVGLLLLKFG
jgi:hypothetical protein